jgi:hypothetical protein
MKMKRSIQIVLGLGFLGAMFGGNAAFAHGVTNAKAAELSLHRVERLVILRKIEDSFQSKPQSIKVEAIAHQNEEDPSFKATIYQVAGADGTQKSIEIVLNEEGKTIKYTVNAGADAVNAPVWADKDATTLTENALHYVLDNAAAKPELVPFSQSLSLLKLSPGTNSANVAVAVVDMKATANDGVLRIRVKLDGTFDSAEVVAQTE